ncbi:type VI secretion system baseplate subunit TssF [Chishuiella sp.]|uniref:type VI secretion system baseplate subunit TssF n=1 Tax=Chishuiella sp. TaxID=1969467 RepID=UPI0028A75E09|nr:type VI secretion system baseplate subunit TssF [Chishuiella sp.]
MNLNQQTYSKESIKARMLQNATRIWGVKNIQSLDPLVKLLIEAFSTEVFKANNEIQNVNGRIVEKLARLLTPTKYTHPSPAHAIAFSIPDENEELLLEHTEFIYKKTVNSFRKLQSNKQVDIPFTPIYDVELINAQTVLMVAGNTVYEIDEKLNKFPIGRFSNSLESYRKIKIGIDFTNYISEIFPDKLSFYFSNPTFEHIDFVYNLLPHVKITCNGKLLDVSPGKSYPKVENVQGYEGLFRDQSVYFKLKEDIENIYSDKFIEISNFSKKLEENITNWPEDLSDQKHLIEQYKERKIIWLTLEFPPQYNQDILENFLCVLNAFPIYNRGWKKTEYSLDIMGNNIPLQTTDNQYFLYVDEVIDEQGKKYTEIPFTPTNDLERGLYTVRKGGMERFNERNAVDLLSNVMELLRDEVAAFSIYNRDQVKDVLGEISLKMKGLMIKTDQVNRELKDDVNYVIIEPVENSGHTYATFWITNCDMANSLRPSTELKSHEEKQMITLLTETTGGFEAQKRSDNILAYKYALTTRDKIISKEDVKNYCKMELRDEVKKINVKRGTMISDRPKEGFIRTVDIEIIPQDYSFYGQKYWDNIAEVLKNNIKLKAIDGIEYRVNIIEN